MKKLKELLICIGITILICLGIGLVIFLGPLFFIPAIIFCAVYLWRKAT